MLSATIQVTENPAYLKQIEFIAIHNIQMDGDIAEYDVYRNGVAICRVTHVRSNGALKLLESALRAIRMIEEGKADDKSKGSKNRGQDSRRR